ncbi:MAG TPA: hypothetical protein VGD07_20520 [Methylomirabilota bacterium]
MPVRVALIVLLLGGSIVTPGGGFSTGDISKDDVRHQIPTQSPHTLERACTTKLGHCRVANLTPPGQPCSCVASTGARVDGYVIAYRWTDVPSSVK